MKNEFSNCKQELNAKIKDLHGQIKEQDELLIESEKQKCHLKEKMTSLKEEQHSEKELISLKYISQIQHFKQSITATEELLSKSEKSLLLKDYAIKSLEREFQKSKIDLEKKESETEKCKQLLKEAVENYTIKLDELFESSEDKSKILKKKEHYIEALQDAGEEKNNALKQLKFHSQTLEQDLLETRRRLENLTSFQMENETRMLSENTSLKGKHNEIEIHLHESTLLIERLKDSSESLKNELKKLRHENANLEILIKEQKETIFQKNSQMQELKDMIKKTEREAKKLLKVELDNQRKTMSENNLQEKISYNDEIQRLLIVIKDTEAEIKDARNSTVALENEFTIAFSKLVDAEAKHIEAKEQLSGKNSQLLLEIKDLREQLQIIITEKLKLKNDNKLLTIKANQLQQDKNSKQEVLRNSEAKLCENETSLIRKSNTIDAFGMAYSEIALILSIPAPNAGSVDASQLVHLVSSFRKKIDEKLKNDIILQDQEKLILDLTEKLSIQQEQMSHVKQEIHESESHYLNIIEGIKKKTEKGQRKIEELDRERSFFKLKLKSAIDDMNILGSNKTSLENDYISVFEKMQEMKLDFQYKSKTLALETAVLIDQNNQINTELKNLKDKTIAMSENIKDLSLEKHILQDQRKKLDGLTKSTIGKLTLDIEQLVEENDKLRKEAFISEQSLLKLKLLKNQEIDNLKVEVTKANTNVSNMASSLNDANVMLEEFKVKLQFTNAIEKELRDNIDYLRKQLGKEPHSKGFSTDGKLEKKLQSFEHEVEHLKKDKALLEHELIKLKSIPCFQ